jgi:hypothetical protein
VNFPKIETLYSLYARRKLPIMPPGLDYHSFYDVVVGTVGAAAAESLKRDAVKDGILAFRSAKGSEIDAAEAQSHFHSVLGGEKLWLHQRAEIQVPWDLAVHAAFTRLNVPLLTLMGEQRLTRAVRLVWQRDMWCCSYLVGAYVVFSNISDFHIPETKALFKEKAGDRDFVISVHYVTGTNPIESRPMPALVEFAHKEETVSTVFERIRGSRDIDGGDHDEGAVHLWLAANTAALGFLLLDMKHRFVEPVKPVVVKSKDKRAMPTAPMTYLIGRCLPPLPHSLKDRHKITKGQVTIEDGQTLIEWASVKPEDAVLSEQSVEATRDDGGAG